jgi:signal transduction histidine kinase
MLSAAFLWKICFRHLQTVLTSAFSCHFEKQLHFFKIQAFYMMFEFLTSNRNALAARCIEKVAARSTRRTSDTELVNGIPIFLDQLIRTLEIEQSSDPMRSRDVSGPSGGGIQTSSEMGDSASRHGRELSDLGFTVGEVVHAYGDLCQSITDLAFERDAPITVDEFRTLNRCLDNAIANAVTEYTYIHTTLSNDQHALEMGQQLGYFSHELRNYLHTAALAFTAAKSGNLSLDGATGTVLERSLLSLKKLIDSSLADVRLTVGVLVPKGTYSLAAFINQVRLSAEFDAAARGCALSVSSVDPELAVIVDIDLLFGAVGNLLQNAFKFTKPGTEITLKAYAVADSIRIDVADHCGGLQPGAAARMFAPFAQRNADKTGLGLGLSITRRSVESNGGVLSVRDMPGIGCMFTISLPRHAMPAAEAA